MHNKFQSCIHIAIEIICDYRKTTWYTPSIFLSPFKQNLKSISLKLLSWEKTVYNDGITCLGENFRIFPLAPMEIFDKIRLNKHPQW